MPLLKKFLTVGNSILTITILLNFTGKFQCGPASVVAVKKGMIGLGYDVQFLFSEVNADLMSFTEDEESTWGYRRTRSNHYQ